MSPKFLLSLCFFAIVGSAFAGINLSPVTGERVLDGIKFQQLIFREGERQITYEPPRGWTYSGAATQLNLTPPNVSQSQAIIDQSPLSKPQDFDEATIKELQAKTLGYIPPGSRDAAILLEEKSPVVVNRHETYAVTVGYQFGGQEFQMSVLYVNLADTQLRFRFVSRKAEFEKLHRAFRGSVFSWQWTKPATTVAAGPSPAP